MKHKYLVLIAILCGMAYIPFVQGNTGDSYGGYASMWMLERSPVFHADKTRTPLLIMAGDKDPRVHPSQSLEMYRHVKLRTETPVRLVFYPGETHGNKHTAAQFDYALRFDRWMNYYLTGPADSLPPYEIDHAARMEK